MRCYRCGRSRLKAKLTRVQGEVRGEKFAVETEALVCGRCGFQVLTAEQSHAYARAVADAYRRKHGLLTSQELKDIRSRLHMSQAEFARYVGVGVASVKRWEAGLVQDESHDRLIRLMTDPAAAAHNLAQLEARLAQAMGKESRNPS